jgi:hypothetical protein
MRKRNFLRLGLLSLVALIGFWLIVWCCTPTQRISVKSFDKVKNGMTKAEIWAIFNCSPGAYCDRTPRFGIGAAIPDNIHGIRDRAVVATEQWVSDAAAIRIWYDADDRVVVGICESAPQEEDVGLWTKIRRGASSLWARLW